MSKDSSGKTIVEKKGMEDEIRSGFDYEMTIGFNITNDKHMTEVGKDRTRLFAGKQDFVITSETGKAIMDWCESGVDIDTEINDAVSKLANCNNVDELKLLKETLPQYVVMAPAFVTAAKERYNSVNKLKTA